MVAQATAARSALTQRFWVEDLADDVLAGRTVSRSKGLDLLAVSDEELPLLLHAVLRVREHYHGRRVRLCMLRNARSGLCAEDCHYCSQSAVSQAPVERYPLDSEQRLLDGARQAVATGARRYCMVTSGRGPSERDVERFTSVARRIRAEAPDLELCVSLGIMEPDQARCLKEAGIGWVNHNLNTSERFHSQICTTHTYADRVRTVQTAHDAGLATCSGAIVGMGESDEDLVDLAFALCQLHVDSLPVNFLHPIAGTPFAARRGLTPGRCLKALCLFRFANPEAEVRVAGGREVNLGWFQALALWPANSLFVDGYLTTSGQGVEAARQMIEECGFIVDHVDP